MTLKGLFETVGVTKTLANKTADQIGDNVESVRYHEADIIDEKRFVPRLNFSNPEEFVKYGSAEQYYQDSFVYIYSSYPYDGSLYERVAWKNSGSYVDLYVFDNLYPRTNGYINFSYGDWGDPTPLTGGYGIPRSSADYEYISLKGGPGIGGGPHSQGGNVWNPSENRVSNLKLDASEGTTLEFWLKKKEFNRDNTVREVLFDLWNNEASSSTGYGRLRLELSAAVDGSDPFKLTLMSGSKGFSQQPIASTSFTSASVVGDTWNHYAVSVKNNAEVYRSVRFDGVDDGIKIGEAADWDAHIGGAGAAAKPYSFSIWVYRDGSSTDPAEDLMAFGLSSGFRRFYMIASTGQVWLRSAHANNRRSSVNLAIGEWYHVAVTYAGGAAGTSHIYINGVLADGAQDTTDPPAALASDPAAIGKSANLIQYTFGGYLNNASIWGTELSLTEVQEIYNSGVPQNLLDHTRADSLVGWYPLGSDYYDALDGTNIASKTNYLANKRRAAGNLTGYAITGKMDASQIVDYAPINSSITTRFYVNGKLENKKLIASGIKTLSGSVGPVTGAMVAMIGALVTSPSASAAPTYGGKFSGSLDEFRYWKTRRSSKDVGRYWFTQVGGGTNTDVANTTLGVYYKFNEGITGREATDATVLDYSGRVTNGTWVGYAAGARSTDSAIVQSSASLTEFKDPIIYSYHPKVVSSLAAAKASGSAYDGHNPSRLYSFYPSWMQEEDTNNGSELQKLTQIIANYFDTLSLQIEGMANIHDVQYVSGSTKSNTIANRLLESRGLLVPELFLDADILESLGDRSETLVYKKSLSDIKNTIYQNIYNNLINIFKTKGTEKSFRNVLRCFGVDDEIYKINVYGNNIEYEVRNNRNIDSVKKTFIDFNHKTRFASTIFQQTSSTNSNSVSYLSSSVELTGGYAGTLETYIMFPLKPEVYEEGYSNQEYRFLTSSLFGRHTVNPRQLSAKSRLAWNTPDNTNYQVYAIRPERHSQDAKFVLTSSAGGVIPLLSSPYFDEVYTNTNWVFAVTVKPAKYPLGPELATAQPATTPQYVVEFKGTQVDAGVQLNSFLVTASIDPSSAGYGFITGSTRVYVGAHRQDFTGSTLTRTDTRVGFCRYYLDDLTPGDIKLHALDVFNYGRQFPSRNVYTFQGATQTSTPNRGKQRNIEIKQNDTLALNWEFQDVTASNTVGRFEVPDFSSGSTHAQTTRYGYLGNLLAAQHTAMGYAFPVSSENVVDPDYILASRIQTFEQLNSADMISVLDARTDERFMRESRPIHFKITIEKSMYRTITENMLNMFSVINDFNNLVGDPVNKYRRTYKDMRLLRQRFFEKVGNTPDLDRYIEFYKWFDSALGSILQQLVPAGADFTGHIQNVIESHLLERSKYQFKHPNLIKIPMVVEGLVFPPAVGEPDPDFNDQPPELGPPPFAGGPGIAEPDDTWVPPKDDDKPHPPHHEDPPSDTHPPSDPHPPKGPQKPWRPPTGDKKLDDPHKYAQPRDPGPKGSRKKIIISTRIPRRNYKLRAQLRIPISPGSNYPPNKQVNFIFKAAAPWGETTAGTQAQENIALAKSASLSQFRQRPRYTSPLPASKRRLNYDLDAAANKDPATTFAGPGNLIAPLSIYSSSQAQAPGSNTPVATNFKSTALITNLHDDLVGNENRMPFQGPFTDRFVGGRQYRHVAPMTTTNRLEGWKIKFTGISSSAGGTFASPGSMAFVPPNYAPGAVLGFDPNVATGQRLRNVGTKRPVNIANILMTTSPVEVRLSGTIIHDKIGNYEKNYQVVQVASRTANDLYFERQTFDFSHYPQSPYPRLPIIDRHPIQNIRVKNTTAISSNDTAPYHLYEFDADLVPEMNTNKQETWSFWLYLTNPGQLNYVVAGESSTDVDRYVSITATNRLVFAAYWTGTDGSWQSDDPVTVGNEWIHIAVTYDGNSTSNEPKFYLNGEEIAHTMTSGPPTNDLLPYDGDIYLGYKNANCFEGYNSDTAFYNTVLTGEEIKGIYQNSTLNLKDYGPPRVASNLLMWWRMGNGPGDSVVTIIDQMGNTNLSAVNSPTIVDISPVACLVTANDNNFALPNRDAPHSNETVIVNRFAAPASYEVSSRGYLDPAHEEKSVYNALPYRNLGVLDHGRSSSNYDSSLTDSIRVVDQINRPRGLRQLQTLHCGQYGLDAIFGTLAPPRFSGSWHKVNRNPRKRLKAIAGGTLVTASWYDNWYVHHPIPRSTQGYSWVTASIAPGRAIFGYSHLSGGYFLPTLPLLSGSVTDEVADDESIIGKLPVNFDDLNIYLYDPLTASANTLGYPLSQGTTVYRNTAVGRMTKVDIFNSLMLLRNGPYGWPSWKQIRTAQHPISRYNQDNNIISVRTKTAYDTYIQSAKGNALKQFTEPAVYSEEYPLEHCMRVTYFTEGVQDLINAGDRAETVGTRTNNIKLTNTYGNKIINYATYELDKLLETSPEFDSADLYINRINNLIFKSTNDGYLSESLSNISALYRQRVYPAAYNSYLGRTFIRENFSITNYWYDQRQARTQAAVKAGRTSRNSQGHVRISQSVWPLDAHPSFRSSAPILGRHSRGAGELQNNYSRYGFPGQNEITAAVTYAWRVPVGYGGGKAPLVVGGDALFQISASNITYVPHEPYNIYNKNIMLVGKDYSLVPEFRISEHLEDYYNDEGGFLSVDNIADLFEITGSRYKNSAQTGFFKDYANSDFMKFFKFIDDDYEGVQLVDDSTLSKSQFGLLCTAIIKPLTYEGFYPAQYALKLATLFSQSVGENTLLIGRAPDGSKTSTPSAWRAMVEPWQALLLNSVKSGVAVGSHVCVGNDLSGKTFPDISDPRLAAAPAVNCANTSLPEGIVNYGRQSLLSASQDPNKNFYNFQRMPFEALYKPQAYLSFLGVSGSGTHAGYIYDNGIASASLSASAGGASTHNRIRWNGDQSKSGLYNAAMDQFLASTLNWFIDDKSRPVFQSRREDQFSQKVKAGDYYALTFNLNRTLGDDLRADRTSFEMYNRASAFGAPFVLDSGSAVVITGSAAMGYIELTSSIVVSGAAATGYIELTASSFGGIKATGSVLLGGGMDAGVQFGLTGSTGTVYRFIFTGSYDGETDPIEVERTGDSRTDAENLATAIHLCNFVTIDGGEVTYPAGASRFHLTQSATGTTGNTPLRHFHGEWTLGGFGGGTNGTYTQTACDRWTIADGGTSGSPFTVTFAMTASGGGTCGFDDDFEFNPLDASETAINLVSHINLVELNVVASLADGATADSARVNIVNLGTGSIGNIAITAATSSNGNGYYKVGGMSSGTNPVYSLSDGDWFIIKDGGTDGASTLHQFILTASSPPFVHKTYVALTASNAVATAQNFVDSINSVSPPGSPGDLNVTASLMGGGSSRTAAISIVNLGTGSAGNQNIQSLVASASYYASGGMSLGVNGESQYLYSASLAPNLPSYFYGKSSVTILTSASYGGRQSLGTLLSNAKFIYDRDLESETYSTKAIGSWFAQQISESFALTNARPAQVPGTSETSFVWEIAPKWECPVLNFTPTASYAIPAAATTPIAAGCHLEIASHGMWHQYGSIPLRNQGIFASITTPTHVSSSDFHVGVVKSPKSLAKLVGFEEGVEKRLGVVKEELRVKEGIVAVPFILAKDGRRKFFKLPKSAVATPTLTQQMKDYIFPPLFDFVTNPSVDPVAMYVFEFHIDLDRRDLADIWQNVLPKKFRDPSGECNAIFEYGMRSDIHPIAARQLINKTTRKLREDLRWLVFKVKQRAANSFEKFRDRYHTQVIKDICDDPIVVPQDPNITIRNRYTYNWPNDWLSIVELVKIDEAIKYDATLPDCSPGTITAAAPSTPDVVGDVPKLK